MIDLSAGRIAVLFYLAVAVAPAFPSWPAAARSDATSSTRGRVALPEEDPAFVDLMDRLTKRSALYRRYAKGFTCREVVRLAKYDVDSSSYKNNEKTVYDYLFEEIPGGRLREVREEIVESKKGIKRRGTDFEPQAPPAYAWATIFGPENRGRFHFRPAGQVVKAYRLLTLVEFVGISPNPGGSDISGWSGRIALEARSLNLWSVHAEPSGQGPRLEAEIFKYQRAFAIAGVPLASRPHGWELNVTFDMERFGLSYPTEQTLSMTSLTGLGKMNLEKKTVFRYEDYRFFEVATEEELQEIGSPE